MSLNLERVLVIDGYFCDDPLDYDLHRAWLIRDDLALYFSGDYLVLRVVKRYTDTVNHPRLYISQELKDFVRIAKGVEQTNEIVAEVAACLLRMSALDFLINCVMSDSDAGKEFRVVR
ncbi:hypothetical protein EHV15_08660 [Paenibacillus oralis]|uniref:Uncharacterized protein n=1 Tax=Paenibacillus oralis TaxID=2490856 RepID=A0A3P3TY01_9BACL|nr:hypothetical protein [Paenibacillus oralis]RRJ62985.1 hypothetical protein EHV15_08660 [Paenibacillus oralis]